MHKFLKLKNSTWKISYLLLRFDLMANQRLNAEYPEQTLYIATIFQGEFVQFLCLK